MSEKEKEPEFVTKDLTELAVWLINYVSWEEPWDANLN